MPPQPSPADPADLIEPYRNYLALLAELHLDRALRGRFDPADVVQEAMLRALNGLHDLRSTRPEVITAWLRKILARTLTDLAKHHARDKRDVALERSLEADLDRSASGIAGWLAADQTSPSERAVHNEEVFRLVEALEKLPPAMREVVLLKHGQGRTLQEIADQTGRTVPAVASLLRRGLEQLRSM